MMPLSLSFVMARSISLMARARILHGDGGEPREAIGIPLNRFVQTVVSNSGDFDGFVRCHHLHASRSEREQVHVDVVFVHGAQALVEKVEQLVVHRAGGIGLNSPQEQIGIVFFGASDQLALDIHLFRNRPGLFGGNAAVVLALRF